MHKKFEINQTKIKGGCQSGRKVVTHNSKSDLPLMSSKPSETSESSDLDASFDKVSLEENKSAINKGF